MRVPLYEKWISEKGADRVLQLSSRSLGHRTIFDSANYARWRSIGIGDRGMGVLDDEAPLRAPPVLESTLVRADLWAVSLSSGGLKPLHPLDVQCQTPLVWDRLSYLPLLSVKPLRVALAQPGFYLLELSGTGVLPRSRNSL